MANFTTRLEAVNTMLSAVGTAPVNSLSSPKGADRSMSERILDETHREVVSRGWSFNFETKVEFTPLGDAITLDENVLRIDATPGYNTGLDLVQRGTKLYDRKAHTYTITDKVTADVIYYTEWDELPEPARRYIMVRATRVFADRAVGYNHQHAFTVADEVQALADLKNSEGETGDHNMLTGSVSVYRTINRGSPLDSTSF